MAKQPRWSKARRAAQSARMIARYSTLRLSTSPPLRDQLITTITQTLHTMGDAELVAMFKTIYTCCGAKPNRSGG